MATISGINYKKIVTAGAETYDLLPFDSTFGTPLAEMIIEVNSTLGQCNLNLPSISDFNGIWSTKITIIAVTGGTTNFVTINPKVILGERIGGAIKLVLTQNGQVAELNVANNNNWYGIKTA